MAKTNKNMENNSVFVLAREREHRQQLEECAAIGGIEWDLETHQFWWSEGAYKLLHISPDSIQPSLQNLIAAFHPSDQSRVQGAFEKLSQDGNSFKILAKTLTPSGEKIPILIGANYQKEPERIIGYIQDYSFLDTERADLLDTLAKYRGIMEGAGNAIILLSEDGEILEGNQRASELLEIEEDGIASLSIENIHLPEDLDTAMGHYQGILWRNTTPFESVIVGQNGRRTPVEISGRPIEIASRPVLVLILHDISQQKLAQRALKRSEHRYRSLVDEAKEGILLLDEKAEILAVNPSICDATGFRRAELLELTFKKITDFDLDLSPVDLLEQNKKRFSTHMEGYIRRKDGTLVPTGFNVARFKDQGQTQFIVTAYDLTAVRAGEEDRLQLQKQLFQAQKQEMLGQLAGSLAHDFNNLLSPILLVSEMLMEDATDDPILAKNLGNINQAAQRARRLVARILDYTRPEESSLKPIDLKTELQETLELLRSSIPHSISIRDTYSDQEFPCMADPDQIHQVIMNIGMNAAQAIGDANGNLSISLKNVTVQENSEMMNRYELPEGEYGHLSFVDDGPGIPDEYLEEIFDPFFTTKTQTDGSGLGLSVVSRIAQNHGGIVIARNNNDHRGAKICVYLPLDYNRRSN
jgi:PAS domain S-box-containing protein